MSGGTFIQKTSTGTSSYGKIGIADTAGQYTYYTSLSTAIAAAVVGDVIVFFTDVIETNAITCVIPSGVDLNLNGYTYTLNNTGINNAIETVSVGINNIYNGRVLRTNNGISSSTQGVALKSLGTLNLYGVLIENDSLSSAVLAEDTVINGEWEAKSAHPSTPTIFVQNADCVFYNLKIASPYYSIESSGPAIDIFNSRLISSLGSAIYSLSNVSIFNSDIRCSGGNAVLVDSGTVSCYISVLLSNQGNTIEISSAGSVNIINCTILAVNSGGVFVNSESASSFISHNIIRTLFGSAIRINGGTHEKYITHNNCITTNNAGTVISVDVLSANTFIENNTLRIANLSIVNPVQTIRINKLGTGSVYIIGNSLTSLSTILGSYNITATVLNTLIFFTGNTFKVNLLESPVGPNVTQALVSTPDLYGNIELT